MLAAAGFFLAYLLAAKLGLSAAIVNASASAIWIPSGIALAAFLIKGRSMGIPIFLAAFAINWHTTGHFPSSLAMALGNTAEGLAAAWALGRFARGAESFEDAGSIPAFVLIAVLAPALSASMGVWALFISELAAPENLGSIWTTWWLGDVSGMLLAGPLITLWLRRQDGLTVELAAAVACAALLSAAVLHPSGLPMAAILLLPVIWAAHTLGPKQGVTVAAVTTLAAALGVGSGHSPWAASSVNENLLLLQGFAAVLATTALSLGAATQARRRELEQQRIFFTGISHDLRTPVAAIKGSAETLLLGGLEDRQNRTEFVKIIERHSDRLAGLADSLLRISVVEARGDNKGTAYVKSILDEAVSGLAPLWKVKALDVQVEHAPEITVAAGEGELLQLVQSLLDNAIKFNEKGGRVRLGASANDAVARIWIEDTGMGILPEEMETLFTPLSRSRRAQTVRGTGLGLFIARRLTEAHGGRLWAEIPPEGGAKFILELPLA